MYMQKQWILFILGVIIFLFPFLGFPPEWKTVFLFIIGFVIMAISLSFVMKERSSRPKQVDPNTDSQPS